MEAGQRVGIWLHDKAARVFLGLTDERPPRRWVVIGKVAQVAEIPIGIWIDVESILEVHEQEGQANVKRIEHGVRPSLCVIRWDYIITVQLLKEAEEPIDIRPVPGLYL
jgi:hypothetical protein